MKLDQHVVKEELQDIVTEFMMSNKSSIELLKHNAGLIGGIIGIENEYI